LNTIEYCNLIKGDAIQVGDEWWDHEFESGGAWITIKDGNIDLGTIYDPEKMKPVRRGL
jgi:hypothetical protein